MVAVNYNEEYYIDEASISLTEIMKETIMLCVLLVELSV
jgi:hypothetical protein